MFFGTICMSPLRGVISFSG